MTRVSLTDWNNFYVISGSAAAGLTGLTFVVIALAADARRVNPSGLHTFVTPTIVHFAAVLAMAAFMCVPGQTLLSGSVGLGAAGFAGLVYTAIIASNIHNNIGDYLPVREDWIWNAILPGLAYAALVLMAVLFWRHTEFALFGVALVSVLLLFIGIHNAWDLAVWMTLRKHDATANKPQSADEPTDADKTTRAH
jgi:hypothetical protein